MTRHILSVLVCLPFAATNIWAQTGPASPVVQAYPQRPSAASEIRQTSAMLPRLSGPELVADDPLSGAEYYVENEGLTATDGMIEGLDCGCAPVASCGPCGTCNPCCDDDQFRLRDLLRPSEQCFDRFISPVSNPIYWEDPRTLTEIRPLFISQWLPADSVFGGGHFQVYAAQLRVALTDRLSFITIKGGGIDLNPNVAALDNDGFANVTAGLKYNFIRDVENQWLVSGGLTYEIPLGSNDVFQGRGDGDIQLFLSNGIPLTDRANWLSQVGLVVPVDGDAGTLYWYLSNHFDYQIIPRELYAFWEINLFQAIDSGAGELGTVNFEGTDLLNLGSAGVDGNTIVTFAVGPKWKPRGSNNLEIGVAYEFPVTDRKDLIEHRLIADLILRY